MQRLYMDSRKNGIKNCFDIYQNNKYLYDMQQVECFFWVGQVPDTSNTECSTIVVLSSLSIEKESLKKTYKNMGIKLICVKKEDKRLTHSLIVFVSRSTKEVVLPRVEGTSAVLRTILTIHGKNDNPAYGNSSTSLEHDFARQCSFF